MPILQLLTNDTIAQEAFLKKNFERKLVKTEAYFRRLIYYIHNKPVHHGFTNTIEEYPWSSFGSVLSPKPTKLKRNRVIDLFDDPENFKYYHSTHQNLETIRNLIIEHPFFANPSRVLNLEGLANPVVPGDHKI
jgi:hypothetical protein